MITQNHWEKIYQTKGPQEVSWTQEVPETSLNFIREVASKQDRIIDVGGGDSKLVDYLLDEGFENITVLDISQPALDKAKERLGPEKAAQVNWVASDIREFHPPHSYDIWHDRATFHFLTEEKDINQYVKLVEENVKGHLIMGTFSDNGPQKCSGLPIQQYDEKKMKDLFSKAFQNTGFKRENHVTPTGGEQQFLFGRFERLKG